MCRHFSSSFFLNPAPFLFSFASNSLSPKDNWLKISKRKADLNSTKTAKCLHQVCCLTVVVNYFEDSELALQNFLICLENVGYESLTEL